MSVAFTPSYTLRPASTLLPLPPGELRSRVLEFVRDQPDVEFSPTTVARSLEASSGAVSNALERLVELGEVVQRSDKPRRFAATSTSSGNAGG